MEKLVGEGVGFERIRRVTGYLSGDVKRFNNGKRAEEKDRVKHSGIKEITKCSEYINKITGIKIKKQQLYDLLSL